MYYLPQGAGLSISSLNNNTVYWASVPSTLQTTSQNALFLANGYSLNSSNANSKCAATLLNTNNWSRLVNEQYATYAIGSPTVPLLITSYRGINGNYLPTSFDITTGTYGYKIGGQSTNTPAMTTLANKFGTSDFWTASPSDWSPFSLWYYDSTSYELCSGSYSNSSSTKRT